MRKGSNTQSAELRTHAKTVGVELQLQMNGEWFFGHRYVTRALALDETTIVRARLEAEGWFEKGNA